MQQKDRNQKLNSGFSLIEVIVVVLIIGIVSSIAVLSISYAYSTNAHRTAQKISSLLDLTRTQSMGMVEGSIVLRIECDSEGEYYIVSRKSTNTPSGSTVTELDRESLCSKSMTITFFKDLTYTVMVPNSHFDITYKKASGAFDSLFTKIVIEGSKTSTIVLVKETGRNYIK